jgi:small neutral amino acid transporter SnatA (MarC family)
MPTVFTSTMIGYTPHALDLVRSSVVTPIATPDMTGALTTTVTSIGTDLTNFISLAWPYLLGLILLVVFIIIAVRIGLGAVRKLGGLGRRA